MTAEEFRNLALALPEAAERAHMGHPDFRVRGKIFATLGYPNDECGVVLLTVQQRGEFIRAAPEAFEAVKGGWGRGGATVVKLPAAKEQEVRRALLAAWRNAAPKGLARDHEDEE
jgi:hypothetical protein